jgi:hypothetical protein
VREVGRVKRVVKERKTRRKNSDGNIRQVPVDQVACQRTIQAIVQGAVQLAVSREIQAAVVSISYSNKRKNEEPTDTSSLGLTVSHVSHFFP